MSGSQSDGSPGYDGSRGFDGSPGYDVAVVGAGPAGLAAAVAAARAGRRVALIDAAERPGGQYWRQPADGVDRPGLHHDLATYRELREAAERASAEGLLRWLPGLEVWTVGREDSGFVVRTIIRAHEGRPQQRAQRRAVRARALVLAPGAYDRQVPFPGWTLPGVVTVGAAQALLKAHGVAVGQRVLVAGTGPFLLPVAAGLATSGVEVVGVHEASSGARWLGQAPALARNAGKLGEGFSYAAALLRHRVPVRRRSVVTAAHGDSAVRAVTVARLDSAGQVIAATAQTVEVDALAVGWGFTPRLELPLALGCATRVDLDGSLVVDVDGDQASSVPGVWVAGEACGVGGAALAVVEGEIAGAAAAGVGATGDRQRSLMRKRSALRAFARAMHRAHPVPPFWTETLEPDTVVCRCEEVTVSRLRDAVDRMGAEDARSAKLLSRTGMGWCQGRVCGYASSCLVSAWTGAPYAPAGTAERPIAVPLSLGTLALDERAARSR
ncbi:MAG: FAD-dependent oxidoreductase [Actinomycetales bacterium]